MDQIAQHRQSLFDRRARIGLVHLIEVDPVRAQAGQRRLDRATDIPPRSPRAPVHPVGQPAPPHVGAELGRDDHVVASALEQGTEPLLGCSVAVGRVEQRDAVVDGRVDDLAAFFYA